MSSKPPYEKSMPIEIPKTTLSNPFPYYTAESPRIHVGTPYQPILPATEILSTPPRDLEIVQ